MVHDRSEEGSETQKRILFEAYRASSNSATVLAWIVAAFEVFFLINTFYNSDYSFKYRVFYIILIITAVVYEAVNTYIKKDFYNRFSILYIANPLVSLISFMWAIAVSFLDAGVKGSIDPTLYMTFSLAIPLCFYMNHIAYTIIAFFSDLMMLYSYIYYLRQSGVSVSMTIPYLIIFFTIQIAMGKYLLTLKRNLSERILRTEEQKKEIEDLSEAQNSFFASMSHEIRTPINTIIGLDEMILRSKISDEVREDAENIQSAGKILLHLLNDLLDISKIESGMMELTKAPYNTKDMFYEIYGMLNIRAQEKGLRLNIELSPGIPTRLLGDEIRIKQILINLINNAIKYTKEGNISVSVYSQDDAGIANMTYVVEDTGMGIREESMPHLFTAYKRLDDERTKYIEGTGLGLSIVKQLITMMNGTIYVDSVYGEGSCFKVVIPQNVVDSEPIGNFDVKDGEKKSGDVYTTSFEAPDARILIVDDTPANLVVAKKLLRDTKVSIDTAENGVEALTMTIKKYYHVIFMDHFMPMMDGVECIRHIRAQKDGACVNSKIVVLTANVAPENEAEYIRAGFDGYLTKPITGKSIEDELKRQLPKNMIHKVDPSAPKEVTEDEEFDKTLKNIFISSIDETARKLDMYLKNDDIKNYTITVHGLKSTANLAGEHDISIKAAQLEKAGKENDKETIGRLHGDFISDYISCKQETVEKVKKKGKIADEDLEEAYMTISEYARAKDYTFIEMVLDSLDDYELSQEDEKFTKRLRELLEKMDYDAIYEAVKQ